MMKRNAYLIENWGLQMYDFCPHCGETIGGQQQVAGQMLVCTSCGKSIGLVQKQQTERVVVDRTQQIIQRGEAAHCPVCSQLVELKTTGDVRSFVPHFVPPPERQMCKGSGKAAPAKPPAATAKAEAKPQAAESKPRPPAGKDLSAHYNRETIKVVAYRRDANPTIEVLNLEYLDKADRVRLQIDALRDILGPSFAMKPYPAKLQRPHLAVWGNADVCVIAKKHDKGGYQVMDESELMAVVAEVGEHTPDFLGG